MPPQAHAKFATIALDFDGSVGRIVLNNPRLNVITLEMMDELDSALKEAEGRADISTVVLRGAGTGFSAGVDVAAHAPDKVRDMLGKFHAVVRSIVASKKVTVAAVHGNCLGGGAELAAVCDLVFTTESATWGFTEISLGCYPPVAAAMLSAVVGQKRAADLILTGRKITGDVAFSMGLANEAVPDGELDEVVEETCERLRSLSASSLAATKKALYAWDA